MFKPWLQSSTDPTVISNTVRGAVLASSGAIILVGGVLGVPITDTQVMELAGQLGLAAGALWTLYGAALKLVVWFGKR